MVFNKKVAEHYREKFSEPYYNSLNLTPEIVIPELCLDENSNVSIRTSDSSNLVVTYEVQCLFYTICQFTYVPYWFIHNFITEYKKKVVGLSIGSSDIETTSKFVSTLIDLNLVFVQSNPNGDFVRPTKFLFEFLKLGIKKVKPIPFNMISHDVAKMDIFLHVMIGDQKTLKTIIDKLESKDLLKPAPDSFGLMPAMRKKEKQNSSISSIVSKDAMEFNIKIGNKNDDSSSESNYPCLVVDEVGIVIPRGNIEKISQIENTIKREIKEGIRDTLELRDYIAMYSSVETNEKYLVQFPDLFIPSTRDDRGYPKSIAIEMELTHKSSYNNYIKNVGKYKNSIKYGAVIWFCGNNNIKSSIMKALEEIGGTGWTKTYVMSYTMPKNQQTIKRG